MNKKLQTLDLEFSEYCHKLLGNGMDPIDFLRVFGQYGFVWTECRVRCAQLCSQYGADNIAIKILTNEDGTLIKC